MAEQVKKQMSDVGCQVSEKNVAAACARRASSRRVLSLVLTVACAVFLGGCQQISEGLGGVVRPRALRDVPAQRLAFRFEPDVETEGVSALAEEETEEPLAAIKSDFETRRTDEALVRTVVSPDGQRALALYGTGDTLESDFRIDLYSADGNFLRNVLPPELTGTFPQAVAWSPDGQQFAFVGIKNAAAEPTPTPFDELPPAAGIEAPAAAPTVAPIIAPVAVFSTEQIYVADRDGNSIRPLTTRDGLIYFQPAWSPDGRALAALACTPAEWDARRAESKAPAGRPRLIFLDGQPERLLSDRLADAAPAWSPDASKVATAFETDVGIYDAVGETPGGAMIPLRDGLLESSTKYDAEKLSKKTDAKPDENKTPNGAGATATPAPPDASTLPSTGDAAAPLSFNPVVRLAWVEPETLFVRTAFQRLYKGGEFVRNYPRWHALHLSAQAAIISGNDE